MTSDLRRIIYGTLIGFLLMLVVWIGLLFVIGCNGSLSCYPAQPQAFYTPIPTLIPASMPLPERAAGPVAVKCSVKAFDLLGTWINAGYPETEPFEFTSLDGKICTATYADDISKLFAEANLWYNGAPACTTCHYADVTVASAGMNLADYQGILAGSRRASLDAKGNDILGGGVWEQSKIHNGLTLPSGNALAMPLGRPAGIDMTATIIFAGQLKPVETP